MQGRLGQMSDFWSRVSILGREVARGTHGSYSGRPSDRGLTTGQAGVRTSQNCRTSHSIYMNMGPGNGHPPKAVARSDTGKFFIFKRSAVGVLSGMRRGDVVALNGPARKSLSVFVDSKWWFKLTAAHPFYAVMATRLFYPQS